MLQDLGAVLLDADKVGHEAYQPHTEVWRDVVATFGTEVLTEDGQIDRSKLGRIVFADPAALKKLNDIMHPRMHQMMKERIQSLLEQGAKVVVLEAAILIEANWTDLVEQVWVTLASEETVVGRLGRLGMSEEQARARIRAQMPLEEKAAVADVIIDTDCSLEEVSAKVEKLWQELIGEHH